MTVNTIAEQNYIDTPSATPMVTFAQTVADFVTSIPQPLPEKKEHKRNELLKQLYQLYVSQPEINQKENRKRYHQWVRETHPEVCKKNGFNKERYNSFKTDFKKSNLPKDQKFISYIKEDRFWYFFSHVKTEDLNYMISVTKDVGHRGGSIARFILGSVKA